MPSPFGDELHRLRSERRLSLAQLATLVPCHRGYLAQIEHGDRRLSDDFARKLDEGTRRAWWASDARESPARSIGILLIPSQR